MEFKKLENAVGKAPFADCILFMCYTGLRITEFLTRTKFSVHKKGNLCALYGGVTTEAGKSKEDFIAMMEHADYQVDIESYIVQTAEKLQPSREKIP